MIAILAAAVALSAPAADRSAAEKQLADLQRIYAQSCEVRAYAAFDDLCGRLRRQVREAEARARRETRNPTLVAESEPTPD